MVVTAAGNLTHERLVNLVREHFEALPPTGFAPPDPCPAPTPASRCGTRRRWSRCTCAWACRPTRCRTRERFACYVLNTLLGGGMSSRLFQNIRERQGLAYAVFSELSPYRDTGCLSIYAGTSLESAPQGGGLHPQGIPRLKTGAGERRGTPPRQGPPQGFAHAGPGIHLQPHVQPGAPGDVLQPLLHAGRDGGEHRSRSPPTTCSASPRLSSNPATSPSPSSATWKTSASGAKTSPAERHLIQRERWFGTVPSGIMFIDKTCLSILTTSLDMVGSSLFRCANTEYHDAVAVKTDGYEL